MLRLACAAVILVQAWLSGSACASGKDGQTRVAEIEVNIYHKEKKGGDGRVEDRRDIPLAPTPFAAVVDKLLKKRCVPDEYLAARYADIFFFRNPGTLGVAPAQEAQLTAALMSQDGAAALEFTAPLRKAPELQPRLAANLVALHVWGRTGQSLLTREAEALFADLESSHSAMSAPLKADYAYMRSLAALETQDRGKALKYAEEALAAEPNFFNAHVIRVAILVEFAERALLRGDGACSDAYGKLAGALGEVMDFAPCGLQAAHLARYLRSQQSAPDQHQSLLLTEAALAVISQQTPAFLNKREKLLKNANRQSECGSFILDNLTDLETRAALGGSRSGGFIDVPILEKK